LNRKIQFGIEFFFFVVLLELIRILPWHGLNVLAFLLGKLMQFVGYRKSIIDKNLHIAFPHFSEKDKKHIISSFYQYFSKVLLESLKGYICSRKRLKKRYVLKNPELIQSHIDQGKSVVILMAHINNWEWNSSVLPEYFQVPLFALYKPFKNRIIDQWIHRRREKKGMQLYAIEQVGMMVRKSLQMPSVMIFLSDQRPARTEFHHAVWVSFFNVRTPFPQGAQVIAHKFHLPVFYARVKEVKKGIYLCEFVPIKYEAGTTNDVMVSYVSMLEEDIKAQPANYMWSHDRWKYLNIMI